MRSGVVLDLQATLLSKDITPSLIEVSGFVSKVGRSNAAPRQFVALGPFRDYSMTAGRPDWSRQLQMLLEKRLRDQGFGTVEREAIGMITQELDLSAQGVTAAQTNRVRMQPAFWLIDGGSQWLGVSATNLSLTLRIQKVGSLETVLRLTNAPGAVMEEAIKTALPRAMLAASGKAMSVDEGKVQAARGYELATARNPLADPNYLNSTRGDVRDARRDNRNLALQRYEAAVALNPNDLEAKSMLGSALALDPTTTERGKALLLEIVAKNDPKYTRRTLSALAMAELLELGDEPGTAMSYRTPDVDLQVSLLTNRTDLDAKFKLGTSLLSYSSERNQKRGAAYLAEVAASSRQDLAPLAQKALTNRGSIQPVRGPRRARPENPPTTVIIADDWKQQYDLAVKWIAEVVPNRTSRVTGSLKHATNYLWAVVANGDAELKAHAREAIAAAHDKYLWLAMDLFDQEAVLLAIANGARIESTNEHGMTPLMHAVRNNSGRSKAQDLGQIAMAEALIGAGANVNAKSTTVGGTTVLGWAVSKDDPGLLEFLLNKGAENDGRSRQGVTPLLIAVDQQKLKSVAYLLRKGADPHLQCYKTKDGTVYSPLTYAEKNGLTEIIELLKSPSSRKTGAPRP
ncbi:MAG TPA: ankyrin repeat domain-containing protein [Candidatus Acidoferrum sp.]|nr:ankyrin repeat domain-containing protein [Candidatus Acidoferrum sp.]